ncbi:hypothetical protein PRVXT_002081 [Proteinivorax tanatarense]|uniref:GHMP kinase N-terminal domain-containing protein n=1 Tax=Proteinivorax tanatarense TaxID=1260629 RepID=A0AAU7VJ81_9FIRM
MKVIVQAPGSCGELIQGKINGRQMLVSYPVNLFSTVQVSIEGSRNVSILPPKVHKAIDLYLTSVSQQNLLSKIHVSIKSHIPKAKGMASSTADMSAAVTGVAHLLGDKLDEVFLAHLLTQVEPTDSTLFNKLTLFDHVTGSLIEQLGDVPSFSVLVLEKDSFIKTEEFHKKVEGRALPIVEGELSCLIKGVKEKKLEFIAKAATKSAQKNQKILMRSYYNDLNELAVECGAYGVNIAHSGTVCGVLHDDKFDVDRFKNLLTSRAKFDFQKVYQLSSTEGGAKIL